MYRGAPKYWSEVDKRVVSGVEIRKTPTNLVDVLGTYVWVHSGDPEFLGDIEKRYRKRYPDDETFIAKHSITLCVAKDKAVVPENVHGHIYSDGAMLKATYAGLKRVRKGWSSDKSVEWLESYWEVVLKKDKDGWLEWEQNVVAVMTVLDDNGHPFLVFDWSHPICGHGSWEGYFVAKKLVEGEPAGSWRLTKDERSRLGIGLTFKQKAQLVKRGGPRVYEEDRGENHDEEYKSEEYSDYESGYSDSEDEREDESGSTEDEDGDTDSEGGQVSESEIETAGGKRKASEDETDQSKRRRVGF